MPIKTFLLSLHLDDKLKPEPLLNSIDQFFKKEISCLNQTQKIPINNQDFIIVYSSTEQDIWFTIRFYSCTRLLSIIGEVLHTSTLLGTNFLGEKLKDKLNSLLNNSSDDKKADLVESVPVIKRDNAVPVYFSTSDGRVLEYDFNKILVNENTEYQNIKILSSPTLGNCLLLDDMQNLAEADLPYTHGLMNHPHNKYKDKEILILGGGDGGLLHELLKESPKFVTMIDIDEKVMIYCRKFLRGACGCDLDNFHGDNYEVIVGDCIQYMREYIEQKKSFDVIFNDLTDIPISTSEQRDVLLENNQKLWSFIREILKLSMKLLRTNGLYLNHAIGVNSKQSLLAYEDVLNNLDVGLEIYSHTKYVPSFMEDWVFYQIRKIP